MVNPQLSWKDPIPEEIYDKAISDLTKQGKTVRTLGTITQLCPNCGHKTVFVTCPTCGMLVVLLAIEVKATDGWRLYCRAFHITENRFDGPWEPCEKFGIEATELKLESQK